MLINQSIVQLVLIKQKLKNKSETSQNRFHSQPVQPSSVLKLISKKLKPKIKAAHQVVCRQVKAQIYADCLLTRLFIPKDFEADRP